MSQSSDDLSAVAWVHEELRRSLEAAHKALRRFGKEAEAVDGSDIGSVDPAVLRTARTQIHQGVGALELVGLPAAALVLRASEALVQRGVTKPQILTPAVLGHIEHASFALLDYLSRMLAGKAVSPLSLFPQYRVVQDAADASRVHPADLWSLDWRWRQLPPDPIASPNQPTAPIHQALENELLALMRATQPRDAARRISDICAGLGAGATDAEVATLWKLAAAVFEAQAEGLLGFDVFTKRVASRLLAQFRILERGESEVSERLARDLLFFCAQSAAPRPGMAPRLGAARAAYALPDETPVDYSVSVLGRFDPALIVQARKRVVSAKEAWSAVAGGEMHRLAGLGEQFALVGDSLKRLFPLGETFAGELQQAVLQTQQSNAAPPAPLAMEVATSMLYTEAALEDADFDDPEHAGRVRRLAERLSRVRQHRPPEPLEGWMEELYRRVSDRQTMGSVVQELRASLSEAEKSIDQFFRNPADSKVLIPVPQQLSAMRGVLSVLGIDHAAAALLRMRDEVDALVDAHDGGTRGVRAGLFDRLAGNLSALGFLIDMLSVQPQMAKSLFEYDAAAGILSPVMGRSTGSRRTVAGVPVPVAPVEARLIEQAQLLAFSSVREDVPLVEVTRELERLSHEAQAADQPALAATVLKAQEALERAEDEAGIATARGELSEALVDFVATAFEAVPLEPEPGLAWPAPARPGVEVSDFQEDDEMRSVFLEEAREVIGDGRAACEGLVNAPGDLSLLTTLRRAFHTLKGSSRMVGLKEFGEAAWVCEQLYNTHLAEQHEAEPALVEFTAWSLEYLAAWTDDIAAHRRSARDVATVLARAEEMSGRLQGQEDLALPLGFPPDLPSAADLELPASAMESRASSTAAPATDEASALAFELDLSSLDAAPAARSVVDIPAQSLDPNVQASFGPFDPPAPGHAPTPDRPSVDADDIVSGPVDLDLGDAADPDPFIRSLEPSRTAPAAEALAQGAPDPVFPVEGIAQDDTSTGAASADSARQEASEADRVDEELVKVVGTLRIGIPLFNIYLNEADELSRRLTTEVAEWAMELHRPIGEAPIALAHSLAGSSATVGFADLSHLARVLEHAQVRSQAIGQGTPEEARLFVDAAEEIRRLLHQFAAGFLKEPSPELLRRLAEHEFTSARRLEAATAADALTEEHLGARPEGAVTHEALLVLAEGSEPGVESASAVTTHDVDSIETTPARLDEAIAASEHDVGLARDPLDAAPVAQASAPSLPQATLAQDHGLLPAPFIVIAEPALELSQDDARNSPETAGTDAGAAEELLVILPARAVSSSADAEAPAAPRQAEEIEAAAVPPSEEPAQPLAATVMLDPSSFEPARQTSDHEDSEVQEFDLPQSAFGALSSRFDPLGMAELKPLAALPTETMKAVTARDESDDTEDDIDAEDAVDAELFPIFEEEGTDLVRQLAGQLRDWAGAPDELSHPSGCMRTLHTLKGGARLAGAMRLGEMAHRLETRIERLVAYPPVGRQDVEALQGRCDSLAQGLDVLRQRADQEQGGDDRGTGDSRAGEGVPMAPAAVALPAAPEVSPPDEPRLTSATGQHGGFGREATKADSSAAGSAAPTEGADSQGADSRPAPAAAPAAAPGAGGDLPAIDWGRFSVDAPERRSVERVAGASQSAVRVRAPLLDRLVNLAGEVSITRSRVESGVNQIKGSLNDLTENLERLRGQVRDIEIQGETQMTSRLEAAKAAAQTFDPLEFDRFTRFQELTRMMAESVNDVATVQRTLKRSLETTEDELVAQARMTRDLQDDLLRTRMVEFEGLSDRLYRVVRLAAKETGKQVRLDIVGGSIEIDRGVLDRMTAAFEHLLRNCVTHGIEAPADRIAAGKDPAGSIIVALSHEGNEVGVEFRDDGAGLNLARIRAKGIEMGLLDPAAEPSDMELANLIFTPGFSTAATVTELAGRGVGMDVVRSDVLAMGGRIETATEAGKGTSFKMILPLTTAVTQVVMLRCGTSTVAVPSTLVETVRRATQQEVDDAYARGSYVLGDKPMQFFWLGALLQISPRSGEAAGRTRTVVVVRSAQQRIAVHVDEVVGNQEVVVKNLGPQLSRLPGLAGMTLLPSGAVALIYNPVALATLYGDGARAATNAALRASPHGPLFPDSATPEAPAAPLVLVVDDSLTVRRVTQRLLVREGFRVVLAKDGLDALERLAEELPRIVLSDIEMPRMDGFDLVRNMRADPRLRALPVIMITSRIAQKHRDHAIQLGVDHYLGKPYSEEDLLALIGRYTTEKAARA